MRTENINKYMDHLQMLSDTVKSAYHNAGPCIHCRSYSTQHKWALDGIEHEVCLWRSNAVIRDFRIHDATEHAILLRKEAGLAL